MENPHRRAELADLWLALQTQAAQDLGTRDLATAIAALTDQESVATCRTRLRRARTYGPGVRRYEFNDPLAATIALVEEFGATTDWGTFFRTCPVPDGAVARFPSGEVNPRFAAGGHQFAEHYAKPVSAILATAAGPLTRAEINTELGTARFRNEWQLTHLLHFLWQTGVCEQRTTQRAGKSLQGWQLAGELSRGDDPAIPRTPDQWMRWVSHRLGRSGPALVGDLNGAASAYAGIPIQIGSMWDLATDKAGVWLRTQTRDGRQVRMAELRVDD